jgi:superfamily I DNA/RNA helicase
MARTRIDDRQQQIGLLASWREGLNPEQIKVVEHGDGPLIVQAVAGCHRKGQLLLAFDGGRVAVEDVKVGDLLMGPDSKPRRVLRLIRGRGRMVEVVPVKGDPFVVNEDHVLTLVHSGTDGVRDIVVRDVDREPFRKYLKLLRASVTFARGGKLPVDPYFLGVLLGDGSMPKGGSVGVSKPDQEIYEEVCRQAKKWGLSVRICNAGKTSVTYQFSSGSAKGKPRFGRNPLISVLRGLGLIGSEKFVPQAYLRASRGDRLDVLAGLLDTDGHLYCNGGFDFISKSKALSEGVVDLSRSLGLAAYLKECRKGCQTGFVGTYYRVSVSGDCSIIPCRIPRKKAPPRRQVKDVLRTGFLLRRRGIEFFYGFTLDGDGRYLLADYTVTHNSGKTESLTRRIARMVTERGIPGSRICAVTFSTKAAGEMNARLDAMGIRSARVGTWHSLALQILREDRTHYAGWQVDDHDRAKIILKRVLGHEYLDWAKADLRQVRSFIAICKANFWTWEDKEAKGLAQQEFGAASVDALRAYQVSQTLIEDAGLLTFDDYLVFAARHLAVEANRRRWAARWDYLFCDEFQDNSRIQNVLAEALVRDHRNYFVVGDCAQSLFSFRGSSPQYIADFESDWGAARIAMVRNYRSGRRIIDVANKVIAPATIRMPEEMVAERDLEGEVSVVEVEDFDDEGRSVALWVQGHQADGVALNDLVCLFRTNAQSRAVEEAFLKARIPYQILGGTTFYERKEVKDLLAYLRLACRREAPGSDGGEALRRCINAPFRYLGKAFVARVMQADDSDDGDGQDWIHLVRGVADQEGVQGRQRRSAHEWAEIMDRLCHVAEMDAPMGVLSWLVGRTGYVAYVEQEEGAESIETSGAANIREMIRVASAFKTVSELLDYVDKNIIEARRQRRDRGGDRVLLCSIHRLKGGEKPHVWVIGCNDGILPHWRGDPEEERRIMYVAITRARDTLTLSYSKKYAARGGIVQGRPSRFLADAGLSGRSLSDE